MNSWEIPSPGARTPLSELSDFSSAFNRLGMDLSSFVGLDGVLIRALIF